MGQIMDFIKKWQTPNGQGAPKQGLKPKAEAEPVPPTKEAVQAQIKREQDPNTKMTAREQLAILDRK
ncbi:MAG: hypothetical protein M0R68_15050 [Bacteroidetes bacterium]|nr:hypothetical protein [Bacteroidota bacterium]